jgi:hypothetical protein
MKFRLSIPQFSGVFPKPKSALLRSHLYSSLIRILILEVPVTLYWNIGKGGGYGARLE